MSPRWLAAAVLAAAALVVCSPGASGAAPAPIKYIEVGPNADGVKAVFTPVGCSLVSLLVPDRAGKLVDVVLGYKSSEEYINPEAPTCFGAVVGQYANRIAGAQFTLNGVTYTLDKNEDATGNNIHSGPDALHSRVWPSVSTHADKSGEQVVTCSIKMPDGDQGYPGNREVTVTYSLAPRGAKLSTSMTVTTDKATPVNMLMHHYFNLNGQATNTTVFNHVVELPSAAYYTPTTAINIPTGDIKVVEGTAFDFRTPHAVGERVAKTGQKQGYDVSYLLWGNGPDVARRVRSFAAKTSPQLAAQASSPATGIRLKVSTNMPSMQLYISGNMPPTGVPNGKGGITYPQYGGLCFEAQMLPNAVNQPNFPSTILQPGSKYVQNTVYEFDLAPAGKAPAADKDKAPAANKGAKGATAAAPRAARAGRA